MSDDVAPGVRFNEPPASLRASIDEQIRKAVSTLPEGKDGVIVDLAADNRGMNAAIVARVQTEHGWRWETQAFVAKGWHEGVTYGGSVRVSWP